MLGKQNSKQNYINLVHIQENKIKTTTFPFFLVLYQINYSFAVK